MLTILRRKNRWSSATTIQQPKGDEEERNADYELGSFCRTTIQRTGKFTNTATVRTEQQQEHGSKNRIKHEKLRKNPTMMMNDDRNDGESFPGRCTKKIWPRKTLTRILFNNSVAIATLNCIKHKIQ